MKYGFSWLCKNSNRKPKFLLHFAIFKQTKNIDFYFWDIYFDFCMLPLQGSKIPAFQISKIFSVPQKKYKNIYILRMLPSTNLIWSRLMVGKIRDIFCVFVICQIDQTFEVTEIFPETTEIILRHSQEKKSGVGSEISKKILMQFSSMDLNYVRTFLKQFLRIIPKQLAPYFDIFCLPNTMIHQTKMSLRLCSSKKCSNGRKNKIVLAVENQ